MFLDENIRVGDEDRTEKQRHATRQRLTPCDCKLVRENYGNAAHTENYATNPRPTQTLAGQVEVCEY